MLAEMVLLASVSFRDFTVGETTLEEFQATAKRSVDGGRLIAPPCSDTHPQIDYLVRTELEEIGVVGCMLYFVLEVAQGKSETLAGHDARLWYRFYGGMLYRIEADAPSSGFRDIKAALVSLHGEPDSADTRTHQNRFGATFEGEELIWRLGDTVIGLEQYSGTLDRSGFVIMHEPTQEAVEAAIAAPEL